MPYYLENLKSELYMLSMHHLSTNTISLKDLKELLIEVESKLPNNFELPRNPRKDIWYFYKTLTCVTYLEDNEIRIILKIPLINTREEYEVYIIHNLPLPVRRVVPNQTDIEVSSIKQEVDVVHKDCSDMKASIKSMEQKHVQLEKKVNTIDLRSKQTKHQAETLQLDVDELQMLR